MAAIMSLLRLQATRFEAMTSVARAGARASKNVAWRAAACHRPARVGLQPARSSMPAHRAPGSRVKSLIQHRSAPMSGREPAVRGGALKRE